MTDVQVQNRVASDGQSPQAIAATTPMTADPPRAATTAWSGRSVIRIIELAAVVALAFLMLDFVFHAIGALNVGLAALTFTVGSFLASPFVGILKTTSATQGNLFVWADVLAMAAYAVVAILVAGVVARVTRGAAHRTA